MEYSFLAAASKSVAGKVAKSNRLSLNVNVNDLIINNTVCCFSSREFCRDEHLVSYNKQYKLADRIDFDWLKRSRLLYNQKFSLINFNPNLLPISPSIVKKNSEKKQTFHDIHYLDSRNRSPHHYSLPFLLFTSKRRKKYHYYQSVRFKFKSIERWF